MLCAQSVRVESLSEIGDEEEEEALFDIEDIVDGGIEQGLEKGENDVQSSSLPLSFLLEARDHHRR